MSAPNLLLAEGAPEKTLSLYLHVPFCLRKCAYCDFTSWAGRQDCWEAYFSALEAEAAEWGRKLQDRRVETVYIGGGTPSLPPAKFIAGLLDHLRGAFRISPGAEISMESNPGTLTAEKLETYLWAGINRLSLGVQSFDDGLLSALGRIHTARQAREAVLLARKAGFENINLDLMYALPGQSIDQWRQTLEEAISLEPAHISAYSLILEEGTPLAERVSRGLMEMPDEETALNMQREATRRLAEAGLQRYEISNYARENRECRHNLVYWLRGDYLGLGAAAHSLLEATRFANPADLDVYLSGARGTERQVLSLEEQAEETVMLATRTARGMDLDAFAARFSFRFEEARAAPIRRLVEGGLARLEDGRFFLTERGMEVQNAVLLELLD